MNDKNEDFNTLPQKVAAIHNSIERIEKLLHEHPSFREKEQDEFLTIDQASEYLTLATQTLYGLVSNRKIPFIKRKGSKRLYFSKKALTDWLLAGKREYKAKK